MSSILNMFKSNVEDNVEINEEEEEDDEEEDDEFVDCMDSKYVIYENDKVKYLMAPVRKIIHLTNWAEQRKLNKDHITNLVNNLKKGDDIIGSFKVIVDKKKRYRLVDGQHRIKALKTIMKSDGKYNYDALIELRKVKDIDSEEASNLFKNSNNVLNVEYKDMPNLMAMKIIDRLVKDFPKMIKEPKEGKSCNKPYINKKNLYEDLKGILEGSDIKEDRFYNNLIEVNNELGMMDRKRLKAGEKGWETATLNGFYLAFLPVWNKSLLIKKTIRK